MHIQIVDLSFTYPGGVDALRGVSLSIQPGESLAIIGQNGAGKTTLVRHLNSLLKPSAGQVTIGDWNTRQYSTARFATRVGYVFQNPDDQLFQSTVRAEVQFGPKKLGWEAGRVIQAAEAALQTVELAQFARSHPYDLSPGQRKRAALAAVLAMQTPIVILDEPTTGQDWQGVQLIGRIVSELGKQGKTVITITHDIDFCAEHFERVVVLAHGQVLMDGSAREVLPQQQILAQTFVEPPQLVRLASRLGIKTTPLNVAEFIQAKYGPGIE